MSLSFKNNRFESSHIIINKITNELYDTFYLMIETLDGLYTPLGIKIPETKGPHPLILLASGNGGEGMSWIEEYMENYSYTLNKFVENGFACAWIRYRTEVELGYNNGGKLIVDNRQGRELFNRSPLEYEDEISIIKGLGQFEEINEKKIGLVGMSHGGEMVLKITSEFSGVYAAVACEPAAHEFLALTPDNSAFINKTTKLRNIESMQMRDRDKVFDLIDLDIAKSRINSIQTPIFVMGRDDDHLQGIFQLTFDLLKECNKEVIWKSYKHDLHGFIYPKNNKNVVEKNIVQDEAIEDMLNYFKSYL